MSKRTSSQSGLKRSVTEPSYKVGYTYDQLLKLSEKELRALYSKSRSVLRKRIERMEGKGLQYVPDYNYTKNTLLKTTKEVAQEVSNPKQWAQRIRNIEIQLNRPVYTLSGARKYYKSMLENQGYIEPGEKIDIEGLNKFFDLARSMSDGAEFDSDRVIQEWKELSKGEIKNGQSEFQSAWLRFNQPFEKPKGRETRGDKLKQAIRG